MFSQYSSKIHISSGIRILCHEEPKPSFQHLNYKYLLSSKKDKLEETVLSPALASENFTYTL